MKKQINIKVYGLVQGVLFRSNAKEIVDSFGLTGYVKNNWNGNVEIIAEGDEEKLKKIAEWAKKGPSSARVDKIDIKWKKYTGKFLGFEIKY